jgi:hypothetical protein
MIVYWVPTLERQRISEDFNAEAPFGINFVPMEKFTREPSCNTAKLALQNAKNRLVKYMEDESKSREEDGEEARKDPVLKLMVLEVNSVEAESG